MSLSSRESLWKDPSSNDLLFNEPSTETLYQAKPSSSNAIFKELTLQVTKSSREPLHGTLSSNRPSSCDLLFRWPSCQGALSSFFKQHHIQVTSSLIDPHYIRSSRQAAPYSSDPFFNSPDAIFKECHLCVIFLQVTLSSSYALIKFSWVSKVWAPCYICMLEKTATLLLLLSICFPLYFSSAST